MVDRVNGAEQFESRKTDVLRKRLDVLRRLAAAPAYKRDLVEEMEQSRSTINRAISDLEEVDLVNRDEGEFTATIAGQLALDRLSTFQTDLDDIVDAEQVLAPLPYDAPIETAAVVGGTAMLATDPAPYRPQERLQEDLTDALRYRAILPALDDPRHLRLLYEHVVTHERDAELLVGSDVLETLRAEFPRQTAAMAEVENFRVLVGEPTPFALGLTDGMADEDHRKAVHVTVFNESGGVHGSLVNGRAAAVRWAENLYEEVLAAADERTDALQREAASGSVADPGDGGGLGDPIPLSLEREGFVRLDVPYFRDRSVAAPETAWRAGLTLPEVHTGYAVARTTGDGNEEDASSEHATLTAALVADLVDGENSVVVGAPGSGKSTTAKRVACEWYEEDRGPVFYREGGRGRPFDSVDDLVTAVEAADGHALVVVEDAVRPDADRVFEAIERLSGADASLLLDARSGEWRDPPGETSGVSELQVHTMPPLTVDDVARIVDQFERTANESVDVAPERLHEAVQEASASEEETAPGAVMLLLHRLSARADPMNTVEARTALEASVTDLHDSVAGDDLAMDVCVLTNVLNAAGLAVEPGMLYAVAGPGEFDAVDDAIDRLEGRVLFPTGDGGGYRTVHEAWSVAFLDRLLAAEGESLAAERVGDAVTALLSLADDAAHRDRIARHRDGDVGLSGLVDDPGEWADATTEALLSIPTMYPRLTALFGDGGRDSLALPERCSDTVADSLPVEVGWGFIKGGDFEGAERAFERLPDDETRLGFERRLGLSWVSDKWGEFDAALDHARDCLAVAETLDDEVLRARAERRMGRAHSNAEEYDAAEPHLRRALEGFEAAGERHRLATVLDYLGTVTWRRGEFDAAREYHERALSLSRELGDRPGAARSLHYLGSVAKGVDNLDAAREYYEESLEINRLLGNPNGISTILDNLGLVARRQGAYDAAREYHEEALSLFRDLDNPRNVAYSLGNLGLLAQAEGDHEEARKRFEQSLETLRELGASHSEAKIRVSLAEVALAEGDTAAACDHLDHSAAVFEDMDDTQGRAEIAAVRGLVAREEGDLERAVDQLRRSVELFREVGARRDLAESRLHLGRTLAETGDQEAAREELRAALDTFDEIDVPEEMLDTMQVLVEICREAGDDGAAGEYCRRARETLADVSGDAAEDHREWIEREAGSLNVD